MTLMKNLPDGERGQDDFTAEQRKNSLPTQSRGQAFFIPVRISGRIRMACHCFVTHLPTLLHAIIPAGVPQLTGKPSLFLSAYTQNIPSAIEMPRSFSIP